MRGTSWLSKLGRPRFGRAEALAGASAVLVLLIATVGTFARGGGDDGPDEGTDAIAGLSPGETFDPLASLDPLASAAPGQRAPGQATVTGPASTTSGGGNLLPPPLGAKRVRGPASGTPVKVGVHLNDNENAGAQFGVAGLPNISDAEVQAVIAQVNKAGGLAGRPIQPVFHRTDPLSGTFDSQSQEACEAFSTDKTAEFVIDNALTPSKVLLDCMAKRKIPLIWELHMSQVTNAEASKYADYLYRPSMPNSDRLDFVIDQLQTSGFFNKDAKVAIARYDAPESAFIADKVWKPRLAAYKIPVVAEAKMTKPANSGGAAGLAGQSSNAVLDFKTAGATHVLFVPSGGAIPLTFVPAAASQGYEPAYALTTQDSPDFLGKNFGDQLENSRVVGWAPDLDGDDFPRGDAIARCKQALADAKLTFDDQIQPYCDAFYFIHSALYDFDDVSVGNLRKGVEGLGTNYRSPFVLGTRFGPRHDGPSNGRLLRYDAAKGGWKYFGDTFSFD